MRLILVLLCLFILNGCAAALENRWAKANDLAFANHFEYKTIDANGFKLSTWQRITDPNKKAQIYIEGDGLAWLNKRRPSPDPTPTTPTTFEMATRDQSENVIYMARPCQYTHYTSGARCPHTYWTNKRYALEVIEAFDNALDQLNYSGYILNGYSGGGGIAVLVAAKREDIHGIRTIAGNLNHTLHSRIHNVSQLNGSLNPADYADYISYIPQIHFVGGSDENVTPAIAKDFVARMDTNDCVQTLIVKNTTHTEGWTAKWPDLLAQPLSCGNL